MELVTWIALSMVAAGIAVGLLKPDLLTFRKRSFGGTGPTHRQVEISPSKLFTYYPEKPQGYVGFTDYAAMSCELNDSLIAALPTEQFRSVGFGLGFVEEVLERAHDKEKATFHAESASGEDAEDIGWLSLMQEKGTDNAGRSTANLAAALHGLAAKMREGGPVSIKYWDAYWNAKHGDNQSGQNHRVAEQAALLHIFEESQNRGRRLAGSAELNAERV